MAFLRSPGLMNPLDPRARAAMFYARKRRLARIAAANGGGGGGGAPTFELVDQTKASKGSGSVGLEIAYPAGISSGDLLVAVLMDDDLTTSGGTNYSVPTDWTEREFHDASDIAITVMTATADGTETGTLDFTHTDNRSKLGFLLAISNADVTGNPIKEGSTLVGSSSGTLVTTGLTTTANSLVLAFAGFDGSDVVSWGISGTGWDTLQDSGTEGPGSIGIGGAIALKSVDTAASADATFTTGRADGMMGRQIVFHEAS